jgi:hypothetical protein
VEKHRNRIALGDMAQGVEYFRVTLKKDGTIVLTPLEVVERK